MSPVRRNRAAITTLVGVALLAGLTGCGGQERSPEAFCEVMDKHRERYEESAGQAMDLVERGDGLGLLGGAAQMVSALGDLQLMWDELAEVAPEEIRADIEVVRDNNKAQLENAKKAVEDPLGALVGGLAGGLFNSGSYTRVNDYAGEHCGSRPF